MNSVQNPAYQAGMEARFAIAARHSRMVRVLRVAVPAAVILSMAAIVAGVDLQSVPDAVAQAAARHGKPRRLRHQDHDGIAAYGRLHADRRPYEVWAKTATQDVTDPDHVDLKTLRAKVLMEDQSTVTLDARNGLMDTKQQLLDLHKDIFLQTSTGYEARLSQAFVDMGKGTVTSDEHVDVKLTNGTLTSDRLRITGGGEVVRFEGNVVMNLDKLDTARPSQPAAAPAAPRACRPSRPRRGRSSSKSANSK